MGGWIRFGVFLLIVTSFGYMIPAGIAIMRRHNSTLAITIVNFLLGWTIIFWIVAFFWSLSGNAKENRSLGAILGLKEVRK